MFKQTFLPRFKCRLGKWTTLETDWRATPWEPGNVLRSTEKESNEWGSRSQSQSSVDYCTRYMSVVSSWRLGFCWQAKTRREESKWFLSQIRVELWPAATSRRRSVGVSSCWAVEFSSAAHIAKLKYCWCFNCRHTPIGTHTRRSEAMCWMQTFGEDLYLICS